MNWYKIAQSEEIKEALLSPENAYIYASDVFRGRFELGEETISKSTKWSYYYARDVLRGRFELGEEAISKDGEYSYYYDRNVLQDRFELGEDTIWNSKYRNGYEEFVRPIIAKEKLEQHKIKQEEQKEWDEFSKTELYELMGKNKTWYKKANSKFPFSLDSLWEQILKLKTNMNPPYPNKIGKINNVDIIMVDGEIVKKKYNMDFVEGGSDAVYDFIPKNQIWVDAEMSIKCIPHIIYHEFLERFLMQNNKMNYDNAHEIANRNERKKIE